MHMTLPAASAPRADKPGRKRHLRQLLGFLLTAAMLLPLCACARGQQGETERRETEQRETEQGEASVLLPSSLTADIDSSFPLGLNACILGLAATENCVFVGGVRNDTPALARMEYGLGDGSLTLGETELLALPDCPEGTQLLGLSCAADRLYVLLGIPEEDGPALSCRLFVYSEEGSLVQSLALKYAGEERPLSILALEDGRICLRDIHHLCLYSADGALIAALEQTQEDFFLPLLLKDELVIWLRDPGTGRTTLNAIVTETASLQILEELADIGTPQAYTQSAIGQALVSNVTGVRRINPDYTWETVFEWYPLTGSYGQNQRYVCQLEEDIYLTAAKDSAELKQMVLSQQMEDRPLIRVGFYGLSEYIVEDLSLTFSRYNPGYRVESIDCGHDEASRSKLLAELAAGDKLDVLVTGCDTMAPSDTFMDLYRFLDRDEELSREDFLPRILEGLETDGELRQIWNSFAITVPMAMGPLTEGPNPLRMADCQSYLDSVGYEGILFDNWITREDLFDIVADGLLADGYQAESGKYCLDRSRIRELVALCRTRPAEEPPSETLTEQDQSQVLQTGGSALARLIWMEEEQQPYRLFDGTDGGDNFIRLITAYGTCFMIPETCKGPENAWGFLRTLLLPNTQLRFYQDKGFYPSNAQALQALLDSCADSRTREAVNTLLERGHIRSYDAAQRREILFRCLEPCLYGEYDIDLAIEDAEGRLNLYAAERQD